METQLLKLMRSQDIVQWRMYHKLFQHELDELTKRKMKQILEQQFTLGTLGEFHLGLKKIISDNGILIREKTAKEHHNGWLWITISPKPSVQFEDFRKKVTKLAGRKMFLTVEYAYEQRSSDPTKFHGYHVHMLAKRNLQYKPFNCKKNIRNTCKGLVGDIKNNNTVNIQVVGDEFAVDKREYFKGVKNGEGKEEKQVVDKIWRDSLDLEECYYKSNIELKK